VDPCQLDGSTSFTQPSTSSKSQGELDYQLPATPQNYLVIQLWDQQDWEQYLDSAEGQHSKRGTLGYLEDKNGSAPSLKTAKAIWTAVCRGWAQLVKEESAPQSWGRLTASGHASFHKFMENVFPMFKLTNNGWKLDYLAATSYPAWRKQKLDENCRWKEKGKGVKVEDDDNDDSEVGMKRKGLRCKSEGPEKKFKGTPGIYSYSLANICMQGNHKHEDNLTVSSSMSSHSPSSSDVSGSLGSVQGPSALSSEQDSPVTYMAAGERESQCELDSFIDPITGPIEAWVDGVVVRK